MNQPTNHLFTVERNGEMLNPLCDGNDFTVWQTRAEAEEWAEEMDVVVCYSRVLTTKPPVEPSGNTTLKADNRRLREALELWQKFYSLASANAPFMQKAVDAMDAALQPALQPAATQPSGNTGELPQSVCKTCRGRGEVADYVGLEMRCVAAPCPDCSATQPATESEVEELKPAHNTKGGV